MRKLIVISAILIFLFCGSISFAAIPIINDIADTTASQGSTYQVSPSVSQGAGLIWKKYLGPDDMTVNQSTGAVSWAIPAGLPDEAFYLGVMAWNGDGYDTEVWIVFANGQHSGSFVYVDPDATGAANGTSWTDAYTTIASACSGGSASGDAILIASGTYTTDRFYEDGGGGGVFPPAGTASYFTTVMADTPGGVIFDGEGLRQPFRLKGDWSGAPDGTPPGAANIEYIAFKGFVSHSSSSSGPYSLSLVEHIKLVLCGGYDQAINDNGSIINIQKSNDILIESCYTYGNGREQIAAFLSRYVIFRRCVARMDRTDANEPLGGFVFYGTQHGIAQNCIVIDSDQVDYWVEHSYTVGLFLGDCGAYCASDYGQVLDITFQSCLGLNNYSKIASSSATAFTETAEGADYENCAFIDLKAWYGEETHSGDPNSTVVVKWDVVFNQCTFFDFSSPAAAIGDGTFFNGYGSGSSNTMTNSIVSDIDDYGGTDNDGGLFYTFGTVNYVNIYNTGTINVNGTSPTNTISTNPLSNGLSYPIMIDSGSNLETAGAAGARVGANLEYMWGKAGTLWGDTDYNTEQSVKMWPFPGENLFKEKMSAYSYDGGGLSGARGFAASGTPNGTTPTGDITLTSYVFEYWGGTIPSDIYGQAAETPAQKQTGAGFSGGGMQ